MSQHFYYTKYNDMDIKIQMGWDKPLQGYYLVMYELDNEGDESDDLLFDNLELNQPHPKTLNTYIDVLDNLNVFLPVGVIEEIKADGDCNMGNKVKIWN